jgi:RNA polymerase primary sigma factor
MSMRQLKISNSITNRESQSLEKYLKEISKIELISAEEEVRLFTLIREGDKNALDRLTKANLRFVVSVAKQYQYQGLSLPDLINEGNIGLINAAQRFDETKGFKFISYAVWWIRQSIMQALLHHSRMIRLPLNKTVLRNRIQKANSKLEQTLERSATPEEIAEELQMDIREVEQRMSVTDQHVSLDSPISEDGENSLVDILENADGVNSFEQTSHTGSLNVEIERALQVLTPRERQMVCYFFGIGVDTPVSLEEIAKRYDLTVERVRQIKDKALTRLRTNCSFNLLRSFL